MPPAGFESVLPASEQPQTPVLDRAATGFSLSLYNNMKQKWYRLGRSR